MQHHSKKNSKGFSLIETVVVIALTVIVGGILATMIQFFYRTDNYLLQQTSAVQSARQGLITAVQDLREASYGDDGSYPIAVAATSSVTFFADTTGNSSVEKIRFYLLNGTLYRGTTVSTGNPPTYVGQPESTTTIATYVRNTAAVPIFQYYDSTGAVLSSPVNVSSIATIGTTLLIDVDPNRSPLPYTLIGNATLRNIQN